MLPVLAAGHFGLFLLCVFIFVPVLATSLSMATSTLPDAATLRTMVQDAAERDARESLDLRGIAWMEHINLVVGSKEVAEYFYKDFLGFSRDPSKSFHLNLGQQQVHLAENGEPAQRIAGSIGLVVPDLESLRARVSDAKKRLLDTQFQILSDDLDHNIVTLSCPWGNIFHIYSVEDDKSIDPALHTPRKMENMHGKGGSYGAHRMAVRGNPGIRYVELYCQPSTVGTISDFYETVMGCTVTQLNDTTAAVSVGPGVHFVFVESQDVSEEDLEAQNGVHICVYAHDFGGLYSRLAELNLIWTNPRFLHLDSCDTWEEAQASRTLRFKDIIDLKSGKKVLEMEHETRPLRHGQFLKVPFYQPR